MTIVMGTQHANSEPRYEKPDAAGVSLSSDGMAAIYLVVEPDDTFESAAGTLFALLRKAASTYPGKGRALYVDIEGHEGPHHGFDEDFFEFQQEFLFSAVAPFVTALSVPLVSARNPNRQRDDLPDALRIDASQNE